MKGADKGYDDKYLRTWLRDEGSPRAWLAVASKDPSGWGDTVGCSRRAVSWLAGDGKALAADTPSAPGPRPFLPRRR